MFRKALLLLSLLIVAGGFASSAQATSFTLAELNDSNKFIIEGDKLFSDFQVNLSANGPNTAPGDLSGITVSGITLGGNHGLHFTGGLFAGMGSNLDLIISYKASVLFTNITNLQISDVHLIFNGAVTGAGFTNVTETVTTADGLTVLGQAQVTNPPPDFDQAILLSQPQSMIRVTKDIFLFGSGNSETPGTATISFIDQVFSQSRPPQNVPEPASIVLLGTGLLGLARLRRGRRSE